MVPEVSAPNPKPQVIPTIQEWYGYEGDFTLTADSTIVINDGANVGLEKAAQIMQENLAEITGLTLPVTVGTEGDIYIESITDPELYDLGDEGYLMVTDDAGIKILLPPTPAVSSVPSPQSRSCGWRRITHLCPRASCATIPPMRCAV